MRGASSASGDRIGFRATRRDALLGAQIVSPNPIMANASHPMSCENQRRFISGRMIQLCCLSEIPEVDKGSVQLIKNGVEPGAVLAAVDDFESGILAHDFCRVDVYMDLLRRVGAGHDDHGGGG
jgi:hypothetical protein